MDWLRCCLNTTWHDAHFWPWSCNATAAFEHQCESHVGHLCFLDGIFAKYIVSTGMPLLVFF